MMAYRSGANAYVHEPATFEKLTEIIGITADFWTLAKSLRCQTPDVWSDHKGPSSCEPFYWMGCDASAKAYGYGCMENADSLPLSDIESSANLVVYSEVRRSIVSEHETRPEALQSLSEAVKREPNGDAALYERGVERWNCILRCPRAHEKWFEEAKSRVISRPRGIKEANP